MPKINLNSIPTAVFRVNASGNEAERGDIVSKGRVLFYEHAANGKSAILAANGMQTANIQHILSGKGYKELNEKFQREHLMYAAKVACAQTGETPPASFEELKRNGMRFYGNAAFYRVLQGVYQEIVIPIIANVYSEAVDFFADTLEVGFGETAMISVGSNDIPIFQDSSWGASRSVPRNRFYTKDYTLNPQPKTAMITAKWYQLVGNNQEFGQFFANLVAGMYAKTMGMWNQAMTLAAADTTLIPSNLNQTFTNQNWISLANKLAALNNTGIRNIIAAGSPVALAKVLPTQATGSTNASMDSALAMLLGQQYNSNGMLGEFLGVRLMPLRDAVSPVNINSAPTTLLSANDVWMLSSSGRKPMTIAYNAETPITIEMDPTRTADFEIGINLTIALDMVAVFSNKVGHVTV